MSSPSQPQRPLAEFFSQFYLFAYDSHNSASYEIRRLASAPTLWTHIYQDKDDLFDAYRDALTREFNSRYGTDINDIHAWQNLCAKIGLETIPDTLEECREVVTNAHVNLVDLVDVHDTSENATIFPTVHDLSAYTIMERKFFPRDNAHAGNLLKYLLRHIFNPDSDPSVTGQSQPRRGGKRGGRRRRR